MASNYASRKNTTHLRFLKSDGEPLANEPVRLRQISHEFRFGCGGFDAVEYAGGNPDGTPLGEERSAFLKDRLDKTFALHNYATLPFYWGRFEPQEGKPDTRRLLAAARYFRDRGVALKGHPLCWHTVCADWLMKYDGKTALQKQLSRVRREVEEFKGLIDAWDVINEVVIMPEFDKYDNAVTRLCKELGRAGIVREVFAAARQANPESVLLINDFNLSPRYERLIEECLEAGVPIDVIGLQTHQHQGYMGRERVEEILSRFERFGLPLHFTENTIISGDLMPAHIVDLNDWQVDDWPTTPEGEERQAEEVAEMYSVLFAHPLVEAVTSWDPADGKWLGAPSGFLRKDNSEKPVYHAMIKLIHGQWHTDVTLLTDGDGNAELCGFRGEYQAEACDKTAPFTLGRDTSSLLLMM
ncbi:MAG: endo-1,4-beta-xylanase [Oscillospiraceae bacterium]|nr:endo-1,4-beta-xylanase [Oscillospiraceae bacterium]